MIFQNGRGRALGETGGGAASYYAARRPETQPASKKIFAILYKSEQRTHLIASRMWRQELGYNHIRTLTSYFVFMTVAGRQTPFLALEVAASDCGVRHLPY